MNTEKKALCSEKPSRWSSVVGMIVLGVICLYCIWQDYLYAIIEAATVPTRRIWLVGVGALLVVLTEACHAILTSHKATENTLWRDVVWKWEKLGTTALAAHCIAAAIARPAPIGMWGRKHLRYVKEYRLALYADLLTSGKLSSYLAKVDNRATLPPSRIPP